MAAGELGGGGAGGGEVRVEHPLGFARLTGEDGDGVGSGGADDGIEEVVEEGEAVSVAPEEGDGVAVDVGHDELTELLALKRGVLGGFAVGQQGDAFFGEGVAVVSGDTFGVEIQLGRGGGVGVIDGGGVLGVERDGMALGVADGGGNAKGRDGGEGAVYVDEGLDEAGSFSGGMGVEAFGAGVGAEVGVEGTILLEEDEDVLDVAAEEFQLLLAGERGLGQGGGFEAGGWGLRGWGLGVEGGRGEQGGLREVEDGFQVRVHSRLV